MQHAGRKSQRRCDSQSKASVITIAVSDWLSYLRCDLRLASASYVDRPLGRISAAKLVGQTHACAIAQREPLSIAHIFYHYTSIITPLQRIYNIILLDNASEILCVCV